MTGRKGERPVHFSAEERAPDAIVVLDVEAGRFVAANTEAERLFGLSREELLRLGPADVSPPHQPDGRTSGEAAAEYVARALDGETPRFEWLCLGAAGEPLPCEVRLLRLPDPTRTLVRGSIIDIRDRLDAQEAARVLQVERDAALEQLSSILASAGDGIYGIDRDDRVTFANPAAARMLGIAVEEMVGGYAHVRWHHSRPGGEPYPQAECPICAAARDGRGRSVTGEVFWRRDLTSFPVEYTCAPLLRGGQITGTVCVFRDVTERVQGERARQAAVEQTAGRRAAELLQEATAALSATMSAGEVADVARDQATRVLGARAADVHVAADIDAGAPDAVAEAVRTGLIVSAPAKGGRVVALPLALGGRTLGVLTLTFDDAEAPPAPDAGGLLALAHECAQALERARLYEAEQRAAERQAFLAEASDLFSRTLDAGSVLEGLARTCVPRVADWCVVNVLGPGGDIETAAVAHTDPERVSWAREASLRYPPDPDAPSGVAAALRGGAPQLVETITDAMVQQAVRGPEHLGILRALEPRSAITVPIGARGRTLAALTLLLGESGRRYGPEDLLLAEELARRAALALENARLYEGERAERERAAFVAELSAALDAPLAVEDRLERLVRTVVPGLADLCTVRLADPDGVPLLAAVAHADGEMEELARRLYGRYVGPADKAGLARVMTTARAELTADVTEDMLAAYAPDPAFLADLMRLGPRSVIVVPLFARGAAIGAMSFISTTSGRRYGEADLALGEEIGRRAGLAIDNARLLEEEQRARADAEAARERVGRLHRLGGALGSAVDRAEVARVIVAEGMPAVGAAAGVVVVAVGKEGRALASAGYPPEVEEVLAAFPLDSQLPLAGVLRTGEPVWIRSPLDWRARFGALWGDLPTGAGLPLVVGGRVIGAVGLRFRDRQRAFDDTERAFLLTFAQQCGEALERAERYDAEHRVAQTLQRSLLPPPPPPIPGVEVALRYLPAGAGLEAGGDWYDVIGLPQGRVGLAVGDVVGRGVEAAAVMGQLQSALRAFALENDPPAAVVAKLSRFASMIERASMATVVYVVLDPATGELRYARAGHPPPLLVDPAGRAELLEDGRGMPLAAARDVTYREGRARIAPGGMLLLYSDGLVERRRESIDVGLDRLTALGARAAGAPAEDVCDRLLDGLFDDRRPADDVALLVLRRTGAPAAAFSRRVPGRATELAPLRRELRSWLRAWGLGAELVGDVTLACGEALANAVEHAYGADEAGDIELRGTLAPDGELRLAVRDFGRWRAPVQGPDRGRGLPIMRTLADDVRMTIDEGGTEVVLVHRIEPRT